MSNPDRISEVYDGTIWSKRAQKIARERIHWICSHVSGERVLDVGCSQGVVSLLLAREGCRVMGVDLRSDAIEYARGQVESEPPEVQKRIEFVTGDGAEVEPPDGGFDYVVLGEILEHQTEPGRLLKAAIDKVRPGGSLVITVPFGLHPDPDHKQIFYLSNFLRLVSGPLRVVDLQLLQKYICCVAQKPATEEEEQDSVGDLLDPARLLTESEKAFTAAEQRMHDDYQYAVEKAEKAKDENERLRSHVERSKQAASKAEAALEQMGRQASDLVRRLVAMVDGSGGVDALLRGVPYPEEVHSWLTELARSAGEDPGAPDLGIISDLVLALVKAVFGMRSAIDEIRRELAQVKRALAEEQERVREFRSRVAQLEPQAEKTASMAVDLEGFRRRVFELDTSLKNSRKALETKHAELDKLRNEVRYKLGDALVSSFYEPSLLPRIPRQVLSLFREGWAKNQSRKAARKASQARTRVQERSRRTGSAAELKTEVGMDVKPPRTAPAAPATEKKEEKKKNFANATNFPALEPVQLPPRRPGLHVACILDEFSMQCFQPECNLVPVDREDWRSQLSLFRPAFLFVESAWQGNGGKWAYQVTNSEARPKQELVDLVAWCREQKIPSVFWNKEDPPNFDLFIGSARLFDHVFTTDAICIPEYRRRLQHDRIWQLPFAAQPAIHNPSDENRNNHKYGIAFAGAWYAKKHDVRKTDMEMMLRPAMKHGLHLFDRMHDYTKSDYYKWPERYRSAIVGGLPYQQMLTAYRKYKIFLNVNSVQDSPTMFSRRVLELLACNTCVISAYALGIEKMLGELVPMSRSEEDTALWLEELLDDEAGRERLAHRGMREVLSRQTYFNRLGTVLEKIGLADESAPKRRVSVITSTNRPHMLDNILDNYQRQAHPDKELVLALNKNDFSVEQVERAAAEKGLENVQVLQLPDKRNLGECLNTAIDRASGDFVTKFDDDNFYAENFVGDLLLPFDYTDAHLVGKCSYYAFLEGPGILAIRFPGFEHRYVDFLSGSALVVKREVFERVRFPELSLGEDTQFLKACNAEGFKMYSADRFNYVCMRHRSPDEHTWKIDDTEYLRKCKVVAYTRDYKSQLVV